MPTIKYIFADGTTSETEVTDEIYSIHLELTQQERRLYWRESRRQTSLEYLAEQGIDFADTAANPLDEYIQKENAARVQTALKHLTDKQRALIENFVENGLSLREIARRSGVSHQTLSRQLAAAYKKLKKFL